MPDITIPSPTLEREMRSESSAIPRSSTSQLWVILKPLSSSGNGGVRAGIKQVTSSKNGEWEESQRGGGERKRVRNFVHRIPGMEFCPRNSGESRKPNRREDALQHREFDPPTPRQLSVDSSCP